MLLCFIHYHIIFYMQTTQSNITPCCINGVNIFPFTNRNELINTIEQKKGILIAINAEKILNATPETRSIINKNIGYADGIGAVLALHKKGFKSAIKIPGCELWLDIINYFYKKNAFYFVGGKQNVIEKTITKLNIQFPDINILGYRNGYINNEKEEELLIQNILEKKPDIIFIAMGSPKQEFLMQKIQKKYPNAIFQGLGGSLDLYVGLVKPVPEWWKTYFKWEGLYRVFLDYRNIKRWKRQKILFQFMFALIRNKL